MMNRLLSSGLLRFLFVVGLLPWTLFTNAQVNYCESPGDRYTLIYSGPDTFYVGNDCMTNLSIPSASITFTPILFSGFVPFTPPGGYGVGDPIPGGTVVTVHYIIWGGSPVVYDTLCFQLTFLDTIPPAINTVLSSDTVLCDLADYSTWLSDHLDSLAANSTDNCTIDTIYHNGPPSLANHCGTVEVTFFVEDESGNISSIKANYTTIDTVGPVLTGVPADIILNCSDPIPPPAAVTATDNCSTGLMVGFSQSSSQSTNDTLCNHYDYTIIRTWSATDSCGNTTEEKQVINIQDIGLPDFDVPADTVVVCGTPTDTATLGTISNITDNCATIFSITMTDVVTPGSCTQQQTILRSWTVSDPCLNSRTKTQTITVVDTIAPTAVFPANITVDCSDAGDLSVTGQPSQVDDDCSATPTVTRTDVIVPGLCDNDYIIERTWRVQDACSNFTDHLQIITVTDEEIPTFNTQAQNRTITCDDAVDADSVFNAWVTAHADAKATDNCTLQDSLEWLAYNHGTNTPAILPSPDCTVPSPGVYRRQTVDFIVIDKCGNRDTTTATFTVADNTPPMLSNCPVSDTITADPGVCTATRILMLPMVMEECGNSVVPFNFSLTQVLTYPGGDPVETPVNDVVFNFPVQGPPYKTISNAALQISLNDVDAEAPTEFFNAYGEDGTLLGQIAHTAVQCGDTATVFTLTAAQINDWAFDGNLQITLKPNIPVGLPGRFSVNPICPGGSVTADLGFITLNPGNLRYEYAINGGARVLVYPVVPVSEVLAQGTNTITYYFSDCAGNEATCSYEITVEDKEAPVIACPPDMVVNLDTGVCSMEVEIPLFSGVTDNCGVTTPTIQVQPTDSLARLITYDYNPNLTDFVANDKTFIFNGLQGNATPGGVQLIITIQADVDSIGEYFEIYDNDGNLLGTTAPGQPHVTPGDCNTPSTAVFTIPATLFNDWASAGDIEITARSFMGYPIPPAGPGWGINPCDPGQVSNDGDSDGSFIYATFSYESVSPVFSSSGATSIDPLTLTPPLEAQTYILQQGTTTFSYQVTDLAGNVGECTFDVEVLDVEPPVALCGPTFIDINPSGLVTETILPEEIDLGSSDNCSIASMTVTPAMVTCNDAAFNPLPVTFTVTDASGNVSTCNTFVNVTVTGPAPTVTSNCGSGTLQFFANPPAAQGGGSNPYQYIWYTPQGLPFAYVQNPVIQDANNSHLGFYNVVIQGVTGCEAVGVVQVTCDLLPLQKPAIQPLANAVCSNENIQLSTSVVCGSTVQYKWYSGTAPGTLLGVTTLPSFSLLPPAAGTFSFYVVVERNGCDSAPSDPVAVQVTQTPTAMPDQTNLILCEGETILLNSINNLPGTTCHWTGPCGFESFNCSPAPILNTTTCNGGLYQLVVTRNGCQSAPATVAVNVVAQPATPSVSNSTSAGNPACEGEVITLTATPVAGAVSYQWTSPTFTTITTQTNVLTINDADVIDHAGTWTVKAIGNPCESDVSQPMTVYVTQSPDAITAAATPSQVCEGQSVQLSSSSATQNVSYLWEYPNGQTSAQQNPVLTNVNSSLTGTYTLTVFNQFGCSVSTFVDVTVIDRVEITGVSSNAPACASGLVNVNLVATLFPIDPGTYSYQWTGPNGFSSVNASATIPNATIANSGPYTLVVTNSQGCSSLPATVNVAIPAVLPTPGAPVPNSSLPYCAGDNMTLVTTAFPGSNATYAWNTPTGTYTTTSPSLTINNLTVADAGAYTVQYMVNDCPSATSGSTPIVVNAIPVILPTSNSPVCEGQTIQLSVDCTTGAMYEWSGPGGFSSSVCNPVIANANPNLHAGTYSVRKRLNGCWSEIVAVNVAVNKKPGVPTAINAGPYCANTDNVMLSVTATSATPGAMYTWYDSAGQPLGAATASLNFSLPNSTQYGNGTQEFYVVASLDGCPSTASVPTVVMLNTIPANQAEAGPDIQACQGDIILLQSTAPTIGTGYWTLAGGNPTGVVIANPDQASTTVSGLNPSVNYLFQWTLSNGACQNYSSDQMQVFINQLEIADAGDSFTACHTSLVALDANTPQSNVGFWSQPASQAQLGIVIVDPANPNTQVTGLIPGNSYIFTWTIDGGCGTSSDAVMVTASNESAFAGPDIQDCGDGCLQLSAVGALSGLGKWSSPDQDISFVTPTDPKSIVCNLKAGNNILVWTINEGECGHHSVDSVVIAYQYAPELGNDQYSVPFGGDISANLTDNDDIPGAFTLSILQQPLHGKLTLGLNGNMTYEADLNYVGSDEVIYQVCMLNCQCVTASAVFNVGEDAKCEVPSIITPNKDGINDAFIIPCLANVDRFPNSKVTIYNQWGDEVFGAEPYQNNWEGTFDGEDLPAGTYFYVVDLKDGSKPMSGYLILQR